jgi:hypothetical protein
MLIMTLQHQTTQVDAEVEKSFNAVRAELGIAAGLAKTVADQGPQYGDYFIRNPRAQSLIRALDMISENLKLAGEYPMLDDGRVKFASAAKPLLARFGVLAQCCNILTALDNLDISQNSIASENPNFLNFHQGRFNDGLLRQFSFDDKIGDLRRGFNQDMLIAAKEFSECWQKSVASGLFG